MTKNGSQNGNIARQLDRLVSLEYDVCGRCGVLFDDQGENGWWLDKGLWYHECDAGHPARIVVRKLAGEA
jgi:hypothetical protein